MISFFNLRYSTPDRPVHFLCKTWDRRVKSGDDGGPRSSGGSGSGRRQDNLQRLLAVFFSSGATSRMLKTGRLLIPLTGKGRRAAAIFTSIILIPAWKLPATPQSNRGDHHGS